MIFSIIFGKHYFLAFTKLYKCRLGCTKIAHFERKPPPDPHQEVKSMIINSPNLHCKDNVFLQNLSTCTQKLHRFSKRNCE